MSKTQTGIVIPEKFKDQFINLNNNLIGAKSKTNLLESKVEDLAIYYMDRNLKTRSKKDSNGKEYAIDYVQIPVSEIRTLSGRSGGSVYEDVLNVRLSLKSKLYIYMDKDEEQYVMKSLYEDVSYKDGVLTIEFNPETEGIFRELKEFTRINLPIQFSYTTNGGYQMYKLLKKHAYRLPKFDFTLEQDELPSIPITFNLAELRVTMGYVDINQKDIKREGQKKNPNFEKMTDMELRPKYQRWMDFKKRVILPGIEEINKLSDIYISNMETTTKGRGNKVVDVTFIIQHNANYYKLNDNNKRHQEISKLYLEMKESGLTNKNIEVLYDDAKQDSSLVLKMYKLACKQERIGNIMGWMRSALKNGYEEPVTAELGNHKRAVQTEQFRELINQEDFKEKMWKKITTKEDFQCFLDENGVTLEQIEIIYDVDERIDMYTSWKKYSVKNI